MDIMSIYLFSWFHINIDILFAEFKCIKIFLFQLHNSSCIKIKCSYDIKCTKTGAFYNERSVKTKFCEYMYSNRTSNINYKNILTLATNNVFSFHPPGFNLSACKINNSELVF